MTPTTNRRSTNNALHQRFVCSVESSRVVYDEFLVTRGGDVNAVIG
ncbi:hypothetical protein [Kribbella sp. NBC_00359]